MKLCSRKRKEEGEENAAFCVLDGTVVRSLNHFLYKYIILESNYLKNYSSSYILVICMSYLLWDSTRSRRQDARGQTGDGGRRVSRGHLATDSIWSKLPSLSVPVSPSPVSREASRDLWRSICGYIPGTRYPK